MIAIDTNVLVYAQREDAAHHGAALRLLSGLAEGSRPWGVPWPCIAEYLRVVSNHRAWPVITPALEALGNLEALLDAPTAQVLGPTDRHLSVLREVLMDSGATGNRVYDAQIFAVCVQHGVREFLTADRDFRVFRGLRVTNPFA